MKVISPLLCLSLVLWLLYRKYYAMIDPLVQRGLTETESLIYRYALALHEDLDILNDLPSASAPITEIRDFLKNACTSMCMSCHRWYLLGPHDYCPWCQKGLTRYDQGIFFGQVSVWEKFRRAYTEETGIRMVSESLAIRLYRHAVFPEVSTK